MAKMILLAAVLGTLLSFHGASGYCGWHITPPALETCYSSSKDIWSSRVGNELSLLPTTGLTGFLLGCRVRSCVFKSIKVTLVPGTLPVINVLICFDVYLDCPHSLLGILKLRATLCVNVRVRLGYYPLVTDSCMLHSITVVVASIGVNIEIPVIAQDLLGNLFGPTLCRIVLVLYKELNCLLNVALGPHPFFPGCQCSYVAYNPIATSTSLVLYFSPTFTCGGVAVPYPTPSYDLTISGSSDPNSITFFMTNAYFDHILEVMMGNGNLNSVIMTTVTTTIIMEHFPEIICPRGLPIGLKIVFAKIYVEMTSSGVLLCFHVHVDVGYETPGGGFTTLLHVDLTAKFALSVAIDCPRGWLVVSVAVSVDIQITTTCKGVACSIGGSAIDELLQLSSRCKDIINAQFRSGVTLTFPIGYSCGTCRQTVINGKYIAWSCTLLCGR